MLVVLEYHVIKTKFQRYRSLSSGDEKNVNGFTENRHGDQIDNVAWTALVNFRSLCPSRLYIKFDYNWPVLLGRCFKPKYEVPWSKVKMTYTSYTKKIKYSLGQL